VHFNEVDLERTQLSQKWAGISKIFAAQWRSMLLSLLMVVESIYFATTFWAEQVKITNVSQESQAVFDFGACLVLSQGNETACMDYTGPLTMSKGVVLGTMAIAAVWSLAPRSLPNHSNWESLD
jgi:predicted ABC-type sugar transport system permease subunit